MPSERRYSASAAAPQPEEVQLPIAKPCQCCHRLMTPTPTSFPVGAFVSAEFELNSTFCSDCRADGRFQLPLEPLRTPHAAFLTTTKEPHLGGGVELDIDVSRRLLRKPDEMDSQAEEEVVGDENSDLDVEMIKSDAIINHRTPRASPRLPDGVCTPLSIPSHYPSQCSSSSSPVSPVSQLIRSSNHLKSPVHARPLSPSERRNAFRYGRVDDGYPDPLADVTRLRVRQKGHKCLYPGARFEGSQKSGRNSYDVTVNIVNVDFAASYLCGYLSIKGLTEDWPELTTYFDAQIVGDRYGFVTDDWGASVKDDLVHWNRFPAFSYVKGQEKGPRMLLPHNTRQSAIFMRWKEHFVVPDHKVEDINGASFAGFYYVCIDLAPPPRCQTTDMLEEAQDILTPDPKRMDSGPTSNSIAQARRPSVNTDRGAINSTNMGGYTATMTGFYYHQNSEPYQQLSLTHVKERFHSSFEFR